MKKLLCIALFCVALPTPSVAMNKKPSLDYCQKYKVAGIEKQLYAEGVIKYFVELVPPSDTPIKRDRPNGYGGTIVLDSGEEVNIRMTGVWEDPEAAIDQLKSVPIRALTPGKRYGFCYQWVEKGNLKYFRIVSSESIAESSESKMLALKEASEKIFSGDDPERIKKCEAFSKDGKQYTYGEAKLIHFAELYPPSDTPIRRDSPNPYGASFKSQKQSEIKVYITGIWKDPDAHESKLELAPLAIPMEIGKIYGFCYQQRDNVISKNKHTYIDHPETIQLIHE